MLSSFASVKKGEIPITFILIFVGRELYDGIFVQDNISQLGHILGGLVGSIIGFILNRKNVKGEAL